MVRIINTSDVEAGHGEFYDRAVDGVALDTDETYITKPKRKKKITFKELEQFHCEVDCKLNSVDLGKPMREDLTL